jgi:hypothetical protein
MRIRTSVPAVILAHTSALVLVLMCGSAHAARPGKPASEPFDPEDIAIREAYRKAITDGVAEFDAGRFDEALGCFRRAHQTSPNARTYRGIGMASFELRDYVAAVRNLSAALKDSRKPLSDEQREQAQEFLERSQRFVAIYTLNLSPPDAQILLDGSAPELQPDGTLMVGLGAHTLEARAKGYQRRTMSLKVRGGERKPLSLTLDPLVASSSASARPTDTSAAAGLLLAEPTAAPSHRTATLWFLGSGASALLAVGGGIYWGVQGSNLDKCRHPRSGPTCINQSELVWQRNAGAVTTIVAGASAATMAILGILSWKSTPRPSRASLSCDFGPFGLTCGGPF